MRKSCRSVFKRSIIAGLVTLFAVILIPGAISASDTQTEVRWGVKIPLRDGIHLNATVYKPLEMPEPLPVVLSMTPYTSDTYHKRAWWFAQNGYVFAMVDVRGRGNSEGSFIPQVHEPEDGYDVVEWLAERPWCNGKVAMWGGSYSGYDQWATAKEFPPHLVTIVPTAAAFPGVDIPFWKNIPYTYEIQWHALVSGVTTSFNLHDSTYWLQVYRRMYMEHRPYTDLPELAANDTTWFLEEAAHPYPDAYLDAMVPTGEDFAHFGIPILTVTGHYDDDQPGALEYYKRHMEFGSQTGKDRHFLIIGPWDHGGTLSPRAKIGGLTFGDASVLDNNDLHRQWYDWTMKDGDQPEFLQDRIAYFVAGANTWKYAESLETIATRHERFYLSSIGGRANETLHSGSMGPETPGSEVEPDRYVYDPLDTRPGELEMDSNQPSLTSQLLAFNLYGNGLVYHSPPFEEDTEISGHLRFEGWISIDVPDTDFQVIVYEILKDGSSVRLSNDLLRARYRESPREPKLVQPGEINRYVFDAFPFFSRKVSKGSRLRLIFTSPNSYLLQKNYNSGGVVAEESGDDARTAHITLYHDADHPSFLELPIVDLLSAKE